MKRTFKNILRKIYGQKGERPETLFPCMVDLCVKFYYTEFISCSNLKSNEPQMCDFFFFGVTIFQKLRLKEICKYK